MGPERAVSRESASPAVADGRLPQSASSVFRRSEGLPGSNADAVYRALKAAILSHDLEAGARLPEVQLAAQFNMSRAPLREALRLLERDGLIEARPRQSV